MKQRTLKKFAKARHSYGHSSQGLRLEMKECRSQDWVARDLRFWTNAWNRKRKFLRKHPDMMETIFGFVVPRRMAERQLSSGTEN